MLSIFAKPPTPSPTRGEGLYVLNRVPFESDLIDFNSRYINGYTGRQRDEYNFTDWSIDMPLTLTVTEGVLPKDRE